MTARALMQQALEALELLTQSTTEAALDYADNAIDALRERLAQPVQEPVAHTTGHCENHKQKGGCQLHNLQCGWPDCDRKPITTSLQSRSEQAQWDAIPDAFNEWWDADYDDTGNPYRKDSPAYWAWSGWKAASKQPEQEPVAWLYRDAWGTMKLSQVTPPPVGAFPVYTTPPQRKPLTDEQKGSMWMATTIDPCSHKACYLRGIADAEAAHGIKE